MESPRITVVVVVLLVGGGRESVGLRSSSGMIMQGRRSGPKSGGTEAGGKDEWGEVGVFDKEYPS